MNTDLGSATIHHTLCNSSLAIGKHVLASVQWWQTENMNIYIMGNKDCIDCALPTDRFYCRMDECWFLKLNGKKLEVTSGSCFLAHEIDAFEEFYRQK